MFKNLESGPNFDRARQLLSTPFAFQDVPLDVASSKTMLNISGDFLYVDAASTGNVTIELNNEQDAASAPFFAQPGFGINAVFKQLKLSWNAQPGKFVRLMYSTGDRIVPTNSTTVNGTVSVSQNGNSYSSSYKSNTVLAANGNELVFSAASNINGAVIWNIDYVSYSTTGVPGLVFIAKASAPGSIIDGDVICGPTFIHTNGASNWCTGSLKQPIRVPAGKGMYAFSAVAEAAAAGLVRSCLYTLL